MVQAQENVFELGLCLEPKLCLAGYVVRGAVHGVAAPSSNSRPTDSMLQTCRSWRHAVQHAAAGTTVINCSSLHSIAKLSQFAAWISKHAGMLAEIHLTTPRADIDGLCKRDYATAAEQIISLALQTSAAAAAASAVAAALVAAAPAAAASAPQPLRLRKLSTDFLSGPGLLTGLPAATLIKLCISGFDGFPSINSAAILQALAGLTGLQELSIEKYDSDSAALLSQGCLQAVAQLIALGKLTLQRLDFDLDLSCLPVQLQELQLHLCCSDKPVLLQHLTGDHKDRKNDCTA
jgi:hypothetical protein